THEARRAQMNIDARIPLSDHFDFFELLRFCEALSPRHVYLTHSPNTQIAQHYLSRKGLSASALNEQTAATD
ncbi:MAG: MBL fold metallo-hydrolase RNA specificity domain-containing protein, partial [Cyclonatronaceae bacterium]